MTRYSQLTGRLALALSLLLLTLVTVACQDDEAVDPTVTATAEESDQPDNAPVDAATATTEPPEEPAPTATVPPTATPPTYEPMYESAACAFDEPFGFDVSCGYLVVPENRGAPDNGRTVRLHVAVFASESSSPAPDPILYLEGGPGGDALETIPFAFEQRFAPFLADRDFIMFDQRGTGFSQPSLACFEYTDLVFETLDQDLTDEEASALFEEALLECRDRLVANGADLTAYNSAESAADVADLREVLGYESWNLYGISYGTRLALTVMRDHPAGIRSVVLDSAYPLTVNLQTDTPANADRAFGVFFGGCAADSACNAAYPDLQTVFFDTVAALDAEPVMVEVVDTLNFGRYDALANGEALLGALFQALYQTELLPILPGFIYDVSQGDYTTLGLLLSTTIINTDFVSVGMQTSVQCREEFAFTEPDALAAAAAEHPELQAFVNDSYLDDEDDPGICEQWGAGTADPIENEAVRSDLPTLILAGEYDPVTPPAWGELLLADLSSAYFYIFPATGHGASIAGDCPRSVTEAFWRDPTEAPDASCIDDMGPVAFDVPGAPAAEVVLVPFTDDAFDTAGLAPEGWNNASPGTFARGASGLDQTALLQVAGQPGIADVILGQLTTVLGIDSVGDSTGEYDDGERLWTLYEAEALGSFVDIGVTDTASGSLVVVLISSSEDRPVYYDTIFLPVMTALETQ